ncbi:alpha/beta fold hydrolase [Clostridium hydrogeniformans]|uniref:alpha/beta fold hydrolase n=1 Tax=Clostridium hydrogeniformans TaxID=349933 RepID=UPI000480EBD2|nr:alpha/beta hydrolase [Clostridium hydrogeniformans]
MRLINYSNSMHTYKVKKKVNKIKTVQYILVILFLVLMSGFLFENISNSKISSLNKTKTRIATIDGNKIHYNIQGQGPFTVVLENDIAITSNEWNKVVKEGSKDFKFFTYDRAGYGKSEVTKGEISPEKQAKELHTILKKSGAKSPYIMVSHGYGSAITNEFLKLYKDEVGAVVLVNGYTKTMVDSKEFQKYSKNKVLGLKLQKSLSKLGVTRMVDKLNLLEYEKGFLYNLKDEEQTIYRNYRVSGELCNTYMGELKGLNNTSFLKEKELGNTPLMVITSKKREELEDQKSLLNISERSDINTLEEEDVFIPLERPDAVINGIKSVTKKLPKVNE